MDFNKISLGLIMASLVLAAGARPALAADSVNLDSPVKNFRAVDGQQLFALCQTLSIPCGLEELREDRLIGSGAAIESSSMTPREILDAMATENKNYSWKYSDGMIHVRYAGKGKSPLDKKIRRLAEKDVLSFSAIGNVLHQAGIKAGTSMVGDPHYSTVTVRGQDVTLREALDSIAKADGKVVWHFQYSDKGNANEYGLFTWHTEDGIPLFNWRKRRHVERRGGARSPGK